MKIKYKIFLITMLIFSIVIFSNVTLATTIQDLDAPARTEFNDSGNAIIKVLSTFGIICSVVMLIILGIKYMMGSIEERAEYKKTLLPYFIGAALVFAASSIAMIIYNVAINL